MRRASAFALVLFTSLQPAFAAGGAQGPATGTVTGTSANSSGQTLSNVTVRLRPLTQNGQPLTTTSNALGQFSFTAVQPETYVIELVNAAGEIVGTSSAITVAAGATVSVTVSASALAAAGFRFRPGCPE